VQLHTISLNISRLCCSEIVKAAENVQDGCTEGSRGRRKMLNAL
jgi:hypothetical protein